MLLSDIKLNSSAIITRLNCKESVKRRLMDIGLTKGVLVQLKGKAPLGDPMLFSLRGFTLAIRKEDAKNIEII